ncbi:MAG: hypothetical protein HDS52_00985 [Barnesiella sp.]|nr:hypothetical protein [Barnesiella sp.]
MKIKFLLTAAALAGAWSGADAKLWINELMQSNIDEVYSGGDFPDSWVEIYNDGPTSIRLANYRIGDSKKFEKAYVLSASVGVGAGGHTLIFCDKEDSGYHTDFRLDSGKGELYLFNPQGEIVDYVSYPKMPAPNVAYGRVADAADEWGYELKCTPREANGGGVTDVLLPEPVFSIPGYTSFNVRRLEEVTVSIPDGVELPADTRLYVTTDGSEPTTESPGYDKETTVRSSASMVVRAKLISSEALSPRATTHSYIYHSRDYSMPVIALNTNQEYLDDETMGIWPNFNNAWRRPVNVEYFYATGEPSPINQLGEFRIHGGWSRNQPQKSFAVYSNKRFGTKKYSYPFWDDKPDVTKSKSFVLRNGGNSFGEARINDSFVQTLFGRNCANLDWQAYRPVICYFNGKYRGLYALRQRSNEDYVEDCYDGLEDIDMLENWEEIKAGDDESFKQLRALYESNPTYEQMAEAIDVENFANLYIANAWATNTDFPGNNIVMWRPTADGGKWRWIMKDLDFLASNPSNYNYFDFVLLTGAHANYQGVANSRQATKLFRVMTALDEFRNPFIDRFFVYLGDFLRPAVTAALIDEQRDELAPEYVAHLACYGNPIDYNGWVSRVASLKKWCAERSQAMPDIICDYFKLGRPVAMNIDGAGSSFAVNGIGVQGEMFEGKWPAGRGVTVRSGNEATGWKVTMKHTDGTVLSYEVPAAECSIVPGNNLSSLQLTAYATSGIDNVIADAGRRVSVNLCSDLVVVEADASIASVTVTDMAGRVIACEQPLSASAQIGIARGGVYIVEVVLADGLRVVEKVIV